MSKTEKEDKSYDGVGYGIGFTTLLTLIFITLRLIGVISWGCFWVLSPTIFAFGFVILLLVLMVLLTKKDKVHN